MGTYEVGLFDGGSLPDYCGSAELTDYVPFIQLIYVRSYIIGLTKIEVDVLFSHSSVHF